MVPAVSLNRSAVKRDVQNWVSRLSEMKCVWPDTLNCPANLVLLMCNPGTLAGTPFIESICEEFGCKANWHALDGDAIEAENFKVVTITGKPADLQFCEELFMSVLCRASGIASYTKKLKKLLSETSWKGELRIPRSLTPGFELIETYAMAIGGAVSSNGSVMSQWRACAFGGIDKAMHADRSLCGPDVRVEVICENSTEAMAAASAGANVIILKLNTKDIMNIISQLKKSHPKVQVQLTGLIDETNIKSFAVSNVDFISTSKAINGYAFSTIRGVYEDVPAVESVTERSFEPNDSATQASPPRAPPSPSPELNDQNTSSTASAPKKLRLNDDNPSASPNSATKPNGAAVRNSNAPNMNLQSKAPKDQNLKRLQRNPRAQPNTPQRPNTTRSQSPGGLQLLQMSSTRFSSPLGAPPLPQSGPTQSTSNQLGALGSPNVPHFGLRLPGQPFQRIGQSMNPGMLGNGPNIGANLLNVQTPQQSQSNTPQPPWQVFAAGAGPMMGGVGLGMRMGGPGGGIVCRSCGFTNGPGTPFCRNCRVPLR